MEKLQLILAFLQSNGPDIVVAALAVLGGLKVLARYTPWSWDDKVLEVVEKPIQFLAGLVKKESK